MGENERNKNEMLLKYLKGLLMVIVSNSPEIEKIEVKLLDIVFSKQKIATY